MGFILNDMFDKKNTYVDYKKEVPSLEQPQASSFEDFSKTLTNNILLTNNSTSSRDINPIHYVEPQGVTQEMLSQTLQQHDEKIQVDLRAFTKQQRVVALQHCQATEATIAQHFMNLSKLLKQHIQ